ncbi:hypothetical protein NSK_007179 [Nannochloropsis salina CCMP1776]|uniref:Uncharacterized protein n=1 Tax=Nannochloropsis salina CCMP1776 TaxID=1027361 RepID=A0A4D9CYM7_9STRA|nr:hypothetical protein NSK_007179 [Nannochloropsis salina CCMP1776]|eukprot:TFJ81508.1 hypothetical protein NSK_007179 [Nannochloropsis salina CCMP1776]
MSIFSGLAPPSLPLEGEYLAELLDAGTGMNNMLATLGFGNPVLPGFWVGKGFCSEGDIGRSKGYNLFMVQGEGQGESVGMERNTEGRLVRKYHMTTQAQAPSFWDKNPSLELDYRGMQHFLGRMGMRDEVREVVPGLYLGLGSFGARESRKSQALPFLLRGPFRPPLPLGEVLLLDGDGDEWD